MTKARDLADLISAGNPLADGAISVSEISDLTATAAEINQLDNTADLPDIRPSLLLDFANSKTLDPRITFTRGSTATYWDGKTTAKAEENLLRYSQVLEGVNSGGNWSTQSATVTDNDATAPDGTTTAAKLQGDGTSSEHRLLTSNNNNTPVTNSTGQFAFSIFAKAGTNNYIQIRTNQSDNGYANFDISSGTAHPTTASASITDVGSGWYRCEIIFADSVTTPANISVHLVTSTSASRPEINTLSTYVHLWGAQLEDRTSVTAYTATTTSPIVKYQPVLQTAASGEARFDHDPVTGESKGLLIEEARTNLSVNSVPVTGWSVNPDVELMGYAAAPDGTLSAPYYMQVGTGSDASNNNTDITISASSSTNYCISCFVKQAPDGYDKAHIYNFFTGSSTKGSRFEYTFSTDTIGVYTADGGGVVPFNYGREFVGNGWVRVWYVVNDANSGLNTNLGTRLYVGGRDASNYRGLIFWGFQVEVGSFPTSYIPTSGSTVTRVNDETRVLATHFAPLYNPIESTMFVDFSSTADDTTYGRIWEVSSASTSSNRFTLFHVPRSSSRHLTVEYRTNDVNQAALSPILATTVINNAKIAATWAQDDFAASANGNTALTDTSGSVQSSIPRDVLGIGNDINAGSTANVHIKKLAYYPKRLPNATLQAMTEA